MVKQVARSGHIHGCGTVIPETVQIPELALRGRELAEGGAAIGLALVGGLQREPLQETAAVGTTQTGAVRTSARAKDGEVGGAAVWTLGGDVPHGWDCDKIRHACVPSRNAVTAALPALAVSETL